MDFNGFSSHFDKKAASCPQEAAFGIKSIQGRRLLPAASILFAPGRTFSAVGTANTGLPLFLLLVDISTGKTDDQTDHPNDYNICHSAYFLRIAYSCFTRRSVLRIR